MRRMKVWAISALALALLLLAGCIHLPGYAEGTPSPSPGNITGPTATPEPAVTPSPTPTAAPTPSPSPAPTATPAPTPAPTAAPDLARLDNTRMAWGPGRDMDGDNRPHSALSYQETYGPQGGLFILPKENKVYLTFDEGYENGYTAAILDVLQEKEAKAVFFVTGSYVRQNADLVRRMIDEGHVLGNHSWTHPSLPGLGIEEAEEELMLLHDYVQEHFDYTMTLFRPPMGEFSQRTLVQAQSLGYRTVLWSFAYRDWETDNQPDPAKALPLILEAAHPGALYLLHAVSQTNTAILGDVIDGLRQAGFEPALLP